MEPRASVPVIGGSAVRIRSPKAVLPFLASLIVILAPHTAHADEDAGARSVFAQGAGNRALALGGAYAAISDDATAAFWNPGGVGLVPRPVVSAGHTSLYGLGIDEQYAALVWPSWRFGNVGFTFRHLGVSDLDRRDDRNVVLETGVDNTQTEFGVSYGRLVNSVLSIGAILRAQRQTSFGLSDAAVGLDLGIVYRPGLSDCHDWARRFMFGFTARNVVRPVMRLANDSVTDVRAARLGFAHWVPLAANRQLLFSVDVEQTRYMATRIHSGVEAQVHPMLALRVGLDNATFTAGTGIRWRDAIFDYSFENNRIDAVHRLGASLHFGLSTAESQRLAIAAEEAAIEARLAAVFATHQDEYVEALLQQAEAALAAGRFDDALGLASTIQVLEPGHERAIAVEVASLTGQGRLQESRGKYADAVLIYDRVLTIRPDDAVATASKERCKNLGDQRVSRDANIRDTFATALDAFSHEDFVRACKGFEAVLAIDATDEEAQAMLTRSEEAMQRRARSLVELASSLARNGNQEHAKQLAEQARALNPAAPGLERLAAEIQRAEPQTRSTEDATPPVQDSLESVPSEAETSAATTRASRLSPQRQREMQELYEQGVAAMEKGRPEDALRYWELVWATDKTHARAGERLKREYLMRGMEFFAGGALADAMGMWENALRIDPTDTRALGYMARAQAQAARTQEILGNDR